MRTPQYLLLCILLVAATAPARQSTAAGPIDAVAHDSTTNIGRIPIDVAQAATTIQAANPAARASSSQTCVLIEARGRYEA